jgi:hypothetical protein
MTRCARVVLSVVLIILVNLVSNVSAAGRVEAGTIKGIAVTALRQPLPDYFLRLRSLDTARLVKVARTNASGAYEFANVEPGTYYIEVLDRANKIISTDGPIVVSKSNESKHGLRTTLISAAALSAGAIAIGALHDSPLTTGTAAGTTFQATAPEVVDAASAAGVKDGVTPGNRTLASSPR